MDQTTNNEAQSMQFSRDDVARSVVSVLQQVLAELNVQHTVSGVAVLPAGDTHFLIDVVMRDLALKTPWGVTIVIPPEEEVGMSDPDFWSREFPITSITRDDLVEAGFPKHRVEHIDDETMKEIASAMEDIYCDHGYWEDLQVCVHRTVIAIVIPPDDSEETP